jgi:ABC-type amino acid transport system permease subunit
MLKITSLASVISLREIMTNTQAVISTTFQFAEWYTAAAIYYLVLVSIFMVLQSWLERRYVWLSQPVGAPSRLAFLRSNTSAR